MKKTGGRKSRWTVPLRETRAFPKNRLNFFLNFPELGYDNVLYLDKRQRIKASVTR